MKNSVVGSAFGAFSPHRIQSFYQSCFMYHVSPDGLRFQFYKEVSSRETNALQNVLQEFR